jgi:hypothetical protein
MADLPLPVNFKIEIERRDGTYYINSCNIVEGLFLWNKDLEKLARNIEPAIKVLIKRNGIKDLP